MCIFKMWMAECGYELLSCAVKKEAKKLARSSCKFPSKIAVQRGQNKTQILRFLYFTGIRIDMISAGNSDKIGFFAYLSAGGAHA
ncbi:MAG: hypothetical protein R8K53_05405 [Mariprofundaceae bacterium]